MKTNGSEAANQQPSYTDAHIAAYPVEYIAGIDLYNAGEFHAAHDVWEERWMGEVRTKGKTFSTSHDSIRRRFSSS